MLSVQWLDQSNNVISATDSFILGEWVELDWAGLNDPFDQVTMQITWSNHNISPLYQTAGLQNIFSGHRQGYFKFQMPTIETTGIVTLTPQTPFGNATPTIIDIGVGEVAPPSPGPPQPTNIGTELLTIVKWVGIGAGVLGVLWVASKVVPSITSGAIKTKQATTQAKK